MAWDGKYLWINVPGPQEIHQIDPSNGHVIRVITSSGVNTQYLAWQQPYLWTVEWGDEISEHNRLVKLLPIEEKVTLDGLRDDWEGFPPLLGDPQGDNIKERTDIKAVYGFTDERYMYSMVEFYELAQYNHLDIYVDLNDDGNPEYAVYGLVPGHLEFAVSLHDYFRGETRIGEFEIGYRKSEMGCNVKEILELKAPLRFFDNKTGFYLRCSLVGQLNGESYVIDETDWTRIRSLYALPEKPAEFKVSDLSISPTEAEVKQLVTISVNVTNIGEEEGSYGVDLKAAGVTVDTKTVTLSGGESTTVIFELVKEEVGTFDVDVSGLKGTFVIKKISTSISCSISLYEVIKGDSVIVSGAISPALAGKTISLTYKRPDSSTFNRTVTTGSAGNYSDSYKTDATGLWSVVASWDGDSTHHGASSLSKTFTVREKPFIETPLGSITIFGGIVAITIATVFIILRKRKHL